MDLGSHISHVLRIAQRRVVDDIKNAYYLPKPYARQTASCAMA